MKLPTTCKICPNSARRPNRKPKLRFVDDLIDDLSLPPKQKPPGWNLNLCELPVIPPMFPKYILDLQNLPLSEYEKILSRLPIVCRNLSIQVKYIHKPVSARMITKEGIELYFFLYQSQDELVVGDKNDMTKEKTQKAALHVMIQRQSGDHLAANNYVRKLLVAIQTDQDSTRPTRSNRYSSSSPASPLDVESFLNSLLLPNSKCIEKGLREPSKPLSLRRECDFIIPQSPQEILKSSIEAICNALHAKRLSVQRAGLEMLWINTSLERTLSSTSIPMAWVVLTGGPPTALGPLGPEYAQKCSFIQSTVIRLIQNPESILNGIISFPQAHMGEKGYHLKPSLNLGGNRDSDEESDNDEESTLPGPYMGYISQVLHLALGIFANSLEVVSTFEDKLLAGTVTPSMVLLEGLFSKYFQVFQQETHVGLYEVLLEFVRKSNHHQANGALMCRAIYLMARSWPALKDHLLCDHQAKSHIGKAVQIGRAKHALLQQQSEALWELLSSLSSS